MVQAVHIPNLDPDSPRNSSLSLAGKNTGFDPLSQVVPTGLPAGGTGGGGPTGHALPNLSARPPREVELQRPQPGRSSFRKPRISFIPKPEYPLGALHDRIEGDVCVKVTLDKNGNVIFRGFVRQLGNEELNSAAREIVQRIRFAPALRDDGTPADQDAVVTISFRLTQPTLATSFQED
jgi:TonB family protein